MSNPGDHMRKTIQIDIWLPLFLAVLAFAILPVQSRGAGAPGKPTTSGTGIVSADIDPDDPDARIVIFVRADPGYTFENLPNAALNPGSYKFYLDASGTNPVPQVQIIDTPVKNGGDRWSPPTGVQFHVTDTRSAFAQEVLGQKNAELYMKIPYSLVEVAESATRRPNTVPINAGVFKISGYPAVLTAKEPWTVKWSPGYSGDPSKAASALLSNSPFADVLADASGLKLSGDVKYQNPFLPAPQGKTALLQFEAKSDIALNAFDKSDNYFNSVTFNSEYLLGGIHDETKSFTLPNGKSGKIEGPYLLYALGPIFQIQSDKSFAHVDAVEGLTFESYVNSPLIRKFQSTMIYRDPGAVVPPEPAIFTQFTAGHVDRLEGPRTLGLWQITGELDWTKPLAYWGSAEEPVPDGKNPVVEPEHPLGFQSIEVDFVAGGTIEYDLSPDALHDKFGAGLEFKFAANQTAAFKAKQEKLDAFLKKIPLLGSVVEGFIKGDPSITVKYENGQLSPTYSHYGGFLGGISWLF